MTTLPETSLSHEVWSYRYLEVFGQYQIVIGQYQVVIGQYQVVVGQYQVVIGHYQVVTGHYQVVNGHYQVVMDQPQLDWSVPRKNWCRKIMILVTKRVAVALFAENQPKWILRARRVVLNPSQNPKRQ